MADQRITELTPAPFVANDDLLAIVRDPNGTASTRRATFDQVASMLSNNPNLVIPDPVPAGTIFETLRDTPPSGWEFMNGQTLQNAQSVYPALWAALPATFKSGANIILPDLRGRVTLHAGNAPGLTGRTLGGSGGFEDAVVVEHNHGTVTSATPINPTNTTARLSTADPTAGSGLAGHTHGMNHVHDRGNHTHTNDLGIGPTGSAHTHTVNYVANFGTGATPFNVGPVDTTGLNQSSNTVIPSGGTHTHNITGGITSSGNGATGVSRNTANTANRPNTDGPSNINHVHEFSHRHQVTIGNSGQSGSQRNMPPFVVVNKMIKL